MIVPRPRAPRVAVLSGGVGGAKLVEGLAELLPGDSLSVVCNTGDDMELWGLHVSPDVDTVLYTLSGLVNREQGWGVDSESFQAMELMRRYEAPSWFLLGDRDLATHLFRTEQLRAGKRLTEVVDALRDRLGILCAVLPCTDDRVRTMVGTAEGELEFQDYFVRRRFEPPVLHVRFDGADAARPTPEALAAVLAAEILVVAPSNPVASIGPMLAVPGFRAALRHAGGVRLAVSPLIAGEAVKGPTVNMMASAGFPPTAVGVAAAYDGLIEAMVIDRADVAEKAALEQMGLRVLVTDTLMEGFEGRLRLAAEVLDFCTTLT
ncbi:MAG: 2-phospho-L-lactate transferase [Candidatus Dormibacteria bacterium]